MAAILRINPADPTPLYAQLERAIKLAIVSRAMKIGDRLPTVRELAVELKINANTVAKVYSELERQGILATKRGVGTFIDALPTASTQSRGKRIEELRRLAERFLGEAAAQGFSPDELVEQLKRFTSLNQEKSDGRH